MVTPYLSDFTGNNKRARPDGRPTRNKKIPTNLYNRFIEVLDDRVEVEPTKKLPTILIFVTDTGKIRFDIDAVQDELNPIASKYKHNYETDLNHVLEDIKPEQKNTKDTYEKEFDEDSTVDYSDDEDYDDTKAESEYEYETDEDDDDNDHPDEETEEDEEDVTDITEEETNTDDDDDSHHHDKKQKIDL
jgi:hypothetical protein